MTRRRLSAVAIAAIAALALLGCDDDVAPRAAARPTAPAHASRALLEQAFTGAVAHAEQARALLPPPAVAEVVSDLPPGVLDQLRALDPDFDLDALGVPDGDPDDPDGVVGGVIGGVVGGTDPAPPPPSVTVQLIGNDDDVEQDAVDGHIRLLVLRAEACRRSAIADDTMDDDLTAMVTLSAIGGRSLRILVSGAGPLTACMRRMPTSTSMALGQRLTFQVTIPAP